MGPSRGAPLGILLALLVGCAPARAPEPSYDPARSLLEVVAVLRLHVPDDTYRFEAARDYTGRNVYRSTLLRLENLEHAVTASYGFGGHDAALVFKREG